MRALALRHPAIAGFGLFALLAGLSRPQSWRKPLEADTAQYLYVAHVMLTGGTPYVDAANNKGPLTYLLFAPIDLVSGRHPAAVRLTLLVFAALAALAVAGYVAHYAGRAAGAFAGVALALLASVTAMQGDDPNTEQYGLAPMAGALYFATRGTRWSPAAAGVLASAAALMNPAFAVVVPFVAWELWRSGRRRALVAGAAGGAVLLIVVLGWLALAGALGDMAAQVLDKAASAASGRVTSGRLGARDHGAWLDVPAPGLWLAGLAGSAVAASRPRLRAPAVASALWILLAWLRVKLATYEYPHHYYPAMLGICIGVALGVATLWPRATAARVAVAAAVLAVLWVPSVGRPQRDLLAQPLKGRGFGDYGYREQYPVARFIAAHTARGDRVQLEGSIPQVYWLTDRQAPTRYFDRYVAQRSRANEAELARGLRAHPPKAVAACPVNEAGPWLAPLLHQMSYRLAYDVRSCRVWLRADP